MFKSQSIYTKVEICQTDIRVLHCSRSMAICNNPEPQNDKSKGQNCDFNTSEVNWRTPTGGANVIKGGEMSSNSGFSRKYPPSSAQESFQDLPQFLEEQLSNSVFLKSVQSSQGLLRVLPTSAPSSSFKGFLKMDKRQLLMLCLMLLTYFGVALVVSLQAPFYPAEAERKGATATQYGLVFGVYELVALFITPIYGKYLTIIGPKFLMNTGIFVIATSVMLFGFLDKIYSAGTFIGLSLIIRTVESIGGSAYFTASSAIIAREFPDKVATTFALLEMFFGLGLIVGPTLGGFLFQIGGFTTPFLSLGSFLMLAGIAICFLMPSLHDEKGKVSAASWHIYNNFGVLLSATTITCSAFSVGFLVANIEPHLRQFGLTPVQVGLVIVVSGGMYAITTNFWGRISDKTGHTRIFSGIGAILICLCYTFLGPAPFVNLEPSLWLCIIALSCHGCGNAAELICSFSGALKAAVQSGFPNDLTTYGMISSMFFTFFALGAFIGPFIGGYLLDSIGFRKGSAVVFTLHATLAAVTFSYIAIGRYRRRNHLQGYINSTTGEKNEGSKLLP